MEFVISIEKRCLCHETCEEKTLVLNQIRGENNRILMCLQCTSFPIMACKCAAHRIEEEARVNWALNISPMYTSNVKFLDEEY